MYREVGGGCLSTSSFNVHDIVLVCSEGPLREVSLYS